MVEIETTDIEIYAEKKVYKYSHATLDDVLYSGNSIEGFFDCDADWEEDEGDSEIEYKMEVTGVVTQEFHNHRITALRDRVENLEKTILEMRNKLYPKDGEEE